MSGEQVTIRVDPSLPPPTIVVVPVSNLKTKLGSLVQVPDPLPPIKPVQLP